MSYLIPLLVIYSLFYTHVNYAAESKITLRFPCSNSGIENPEKMMQENKEAVNAVLMRLKKTPGAVYIAGVDYYAETHTGSERDEAKGTGVLTRRSTDTSAIMGNLVDHLVSD